MSDLEDLSAKAARLWFEFMQAQAKAATDAAEKLPEVTRSLAEAGVPLAAEVNRWFEGARPAARSAHAEPAPQVKRHPRLRPRNSHQGMISLASRQRAHLSVRSVAAIIAG